MFTYLWNLIKSYAQYIFIDCLRFNEIKDRMAITGMLAAAPPILLGIPIPVDNIWIVGGIKLLAICAAGVATGYCTEKGKQWAIKHPDFWIARIFIKKSKQFKDDQQENPSKKAS